MTEQPTTVGQRIRELRTTYGISQADLARSVGLSRSSIANIEAGTQSPPLEKLTAIAAHFGCLVSALLGETLLPTLPDVWIITKCDLHCALCGWLDDGLTPEEAERHRSEHLALHIAHPDLGTPAAADPPPVVLDGELV